MTLAERKLIEVLDKGKTVEIPSLGLTMKKIDHSSEIDTIVDELQFQLEHINGIDSKNYTRIELLTLADQLRSAIVNAQLDMDKLIGELKG